MVTFDATRAVTSADRWRRSAEWASVRSLDATSFSQEVVVFAAHPDDETLGVGALMADVAASGTRMHVVFATCGDALDETARRRRAEAELAVSVLAPGARTTYLDLPDAGLKHHRAELSRAVEAVLDGHPSADVLVTWRGDGHGDHRTLGEVVVELATASSRRVFEYPLWLWQWGVPADVPWHRVRTLTPSPDARAAQAHAVAVYTSQTSGDDPVLVGSFLDHFRSRPEVVLIESDDADASAVAEAAASADSVADHVAAADIDDRGGDTSDGDRTAEAEVDRAEHFERLHRDSADPWGFETRWYERRKRAVLMASLPKERYGRTIEVGCSTGVLAAELAARSERMLAVDVSPSAVRRTAARLAELDGAEALVLDVATEWPAGRFDLVVFSEVGYYLAPEVWRSVASRAELSLAPGGTIVLCHWSTREGDFAQDPHDVHRAFAAVAGRAPVVAHREREFLLDVYTGRQE